MLTVRSVRINLDSAEVCMDFTSAGGVAKIITVRRFAKF
jgi:hypothetical protein